jgi:hypothetical protein
MPTDLNVRITADTSALNSGLSAGTASVEKFSTNLKSAMAANVMAVNQLADAERQLGSAAEQGNTQAAVVLEEYRAQVAATEAAVARFSETEAQEERVVRSSISTRMAANAELRVMEGNMMGSTRAAGALLSTIPGLGAAMQMAFPVFGAIALVEILGTMAEKIHKITDEYYNLTSMVEAYHKKLLEVDAQQTSSTEKALRNLREQQVIYAELSGGKTGRADRGAEAGAAFDIIQDQEKIKSAAAQMDALSKSIEKLRTEASGMGERNGMMVPISDFEARQAKVLLDKELQDYRSFSIQLKDAQDDLTTHQQQETLRKLEVSEKDSGLEDKANAKRLKAMEEEYNQTVLNGGKTLNFEYNFWNARLALFEAGSTQYDTILQKLATSAEQSAKRAHSAIELFKTGNPIGALDSLTGDKHTKVDEGDSDAIRGQAAAYKMVAEAAQKAAEEVAKLNIETQHQKAAGAIQLQITKIQTGQSLGITDPQKDLDALQTLHQQAIAEDERYLNQVLALDRQIAQQEQQLYATDGNKVREIQARLNEEILALERKLQADKQKLQQVEVQDTKRILQQQMQNYKKVYDAITQDFNSAISKMITTTEGPAKAFAQMLNQMLGQLATFVLQYLEKKAEMWLMDEIFGKTAASTSAITQITSDAAVAGAGAYAATAAIPFVGPALAPAAAATAYAGAISFLGLAAFEAGGVVNGAHGMPVPIVAHAGERVLSTAQTQTFERMVNSPSGGGSNIHLNYSPNVNAFDRHGFRSTLQAHKDDIVSIVRQAVNTGALARG